MSGLWKILLVEDNPGDVRIIEELLARAGRQDFVLDNVSDLEAAKARFAAQSFDVVLLDLGLPDSDGLETLRAVRAAAPRLPIVVLTGGPENYSAAEAIEAGAQDYLVKQRFNSELVSRVLKYAIEKNRLSADLEETRQQVARQKALDAMLRMSAPSSTRATAESYGELSLRHANEQVFKLLNDEYYGLLKSALEYRSYREAPGLETQIKAYAQRLGSLRAAPRDVVEIHVEVCRRMTKNSNLQKRDFINSEAQLLLIEAMGYLALYYRTFMSPMPHRRAAQEKKDV